MVNEILLLKFAHLLCLVYWLGGDLGVFYSSYYVADPKHPPATRVVIAKILFALDQAPRICMTMILATGVHLAHALGLIALPETVVWITWLVCLGWLSMVLYLHFKGHGNVLMTRIDYGFRIAMVLGLAAIAIQSLAGEGWMLSNWLPIKLLVFAGLISCGLMVRRQLKPFGPAFAQLAQGDANEQVNADIRSSLGRTRPFVVAIWIGLLFNTALGLHLIQI